MKFLDLVKSFIKIIEIKIYSFLKNKIKVKEKTTKILIYKLTKFYFY